VATFKDRNLPSFLISLGRGPTGRWDSVTTGFVVLPPAHEGVSVRFGSFRAAFDEVAPIRTQGNLKNENSAARATSFNLYTQVFIFGLSTAYAKQIMLL
jgi:hypothetical protein